MNAIRVIIFLLSAFLCGVAQAQIGPPPATPGGSNGQIQYNNSGAFGGFTQSGDCVTTTSSGVTVCKQGRQSYIAGNYYTEYLTTGGASLVDSTITTNLAVCHLAYFKGQATIDRLGGFVNVVAAGGSFSVAIYAINNSTGKPTGSPLVSSGLLSTTTGGSVVGNVSTQLGSASSTFTPYAYCYNANSIAINAHMIASNSNSLFFASDVGASTVGTLVLGTTAISGWNTSQTCCTWPDFTSATFNDTTVSLPVSLFRVSTVP